MHRTKIVDVHDPLEHIQGGIGKGAAMGNTGVIDQHIDTTKMLNGLGHARLHPLDIRHITAITQRLHVVMVVQMLNQTVQCILLKIQYYQPRTCLGKAQHQRPSDTGTATTDQNHFALENLAGKNLAMHVQPRR